MKVECPVCGVEGFLEVRGNSKRVLHYRGFRDGKRVYVKHAVDMGITIGNNGNKLVGIPLLFDGEGKGRIGLQQPYKASNELFSSVSRGSQADYGASLENWCSS